MSTRQLSRDKTRSRAGVIRSGKGSDAANDNLTDRICQIWQPRLGRDLSHDEAKQNVAQDCLTSQNKEAGSKDGP